MSIKTSIENSILTFMSRTRPPFHDDRHTASTAAGNNHVAVKVDGVHYGFASGMAPRAQ